MAVVSLHYVSFNIALLPLPFSDLSFYHDFYFYIRDGDDLTNAAQFSYGDLSLLYLESRKG